ncbi:YgiT-type zinc finger domain-containing protein [Roseovarius marisflavi]|uniref:YgiT-type zinc finger domain-containing protein n=1 Tax=Roseovarius marisflavi TaxID=1054996 RepID=A0A1M7BRQ6_9RHOB|nr:YgiT-type zinc finger protein [Roseovarius marisflavi]SHL57613.1 YgiT-type zinc finger domain-containing protein [Roseovarius marisflavi]
MPLSELPDQAQEEHAAPASEATAEQAMCTACSGGFLTRQDVKTALWEGEGLVVIEGIAALVCQSCGEQYYEDDTAMKLDLMRGTGFSAENAVRSMTVPVFVFETPGTDHEAEEK